MKIRKKDMKVIREILADMIDAHGATVHAGVTISTAVLIRILKIPSLKDHSNRVRLADHLRKNGIQVLQVDDDIAAFYSESAIHDSIRKLLRGKLTRTEVFEPGEFRNQFSAKGFNSTNLKKFVTKSECPRMEKWLNRKK